MTKPAEIIIRSNAAEGSADFVSIGTVTFDAYGTTIEYDESELSGMEGAVTKIAVTDNVITVNRFGTFVQTLVFEEGCEFSALLSSPYGELSVTVLAEKVFSLVTETEINIELVYFLIVGGEKQHNSLNIQCRF